MLARWGFGGLSSAMKASKGEVGLQLGCKLDPRWAQEGPGGPKMAQDRPKMRPNVQVGPTSQLARRFSSKSSRKCSLLLPGCGKGRRPFFFLFCLSLVRQRSPLSCCRLRSRSARSALGRLDRALARVPEPAVQCRGSLSCHGSCAMLIA